MIYVSFNMSNLKVCTWNVRRANLKSDITWSIINDIQADILCLQEVNSLPNDFDSQYSILSRNALTKEQNIQKFCTVIAVKGKINQEIQLRSNLKSIIDASKDPNFPGNISLGFSDNLNAKGMELACENNIDRGIIIIKIFFILILLDLMNPENYI